MNGPFPCCTRAYPPPQGHNGRRRKNSSFPAPQRLFGTCPARERPRHGPCPVFTPGQAAGREASARILMPCCAPGTPCGQKPRVQRPSPAENFFRTRERPPYQSAPCGTAQGPAQSAAPFPRRMPPPVIGNHDAENYSFPRRMEKNRVLLPGATLGIPFPRNMGKHASYGMGRHCP